MDTIAPCLNSSIPHGLSSADKILLLDYVSTSQQFINNILANFSRPRDFHNNPPSLGSMIQLAIFVSSAANSSLLSIMNLRSDCDPKILRNIPTLFNFRFGPQVLDLYKKISDIYGTSETPAAVQRYCSMKIMRASTAYHSHISS